MSMHDGVSRRTLLAIAAAVAALVSGAMRADAGAQPQAGAVCTLKVAGMACGACAARVEKVARKIPGVTGAKASQSKGVAEITYDPAQTTPDAIAKAISQKSGFKTEVVRQEHE